MTPFFPSVTWLRSRTHDRRCRVTGSSPGATRSRFEGPTHVKSVKAQRLLIGGEPSLKRECQLDHSPPMTVAQNFRAARLHVDGETEAGWDVQHAQSSERKARCGLQHNTAR
ncbi:hypothetical protein TNCV_237861 [Trichonephila clavipes]|nr:hypothetical protein TNCV_237861 [Trichonephila clavipes]